MLKGLFAALFGVALCSAADAALSASGKVVAGASARQNYWLSDGLNRLVFLEAPQAARATSPAR